MPADGVDYHALFPLLPDMPRRSAQLVENMNKNLHALASCLLTEYNGPAAYHPDNLKIINDDSPRRDATYYDIRAAKCIGQLTDLSKTLPNGEHSNTCTGMPCCCDRCMFQGAYFDAAIAVEYYCSIRNSQLDALEPSDKIINEMLAIYFSTESLCNRHFMEGYLSSLGENVSLSNDHNTDPYKLQAPFTSNISDNDVLAQNVNSYDFNTRIAYYDALSDEVKEKYYTLADTYRKYAWNPPKIVISDNRFL